MRDNQIAVRFDGLVSLQEYHKAISHFATLVAALSDEVAGKDVVVWHLSDLEFGSATIEVTGEAHDVQLVRNVVAAFATATKAAAKRQPIPYSPLIRAPLTALTKLINANIRAIEFRTSIGDVSVNNPVATPEKVNTRRIGLGSVRGEVETLSKHTRPYFVLCDRVFDKAVRCFMAPEQMETMRDIWGRQVVVTGTVTRELATGRPLEVRDVIDIEVVQMLAPDSYRSLRGILGAAIGLPSSEKRIRRIRDESQ
jgi:hypothetical protein